MDLTPSFFDTELKMNTSLDMSLCPCYFLMEDIFLMDTITYVYPQVMSSAGVKLLPELSIRHYMKALPIEA